MSPLAVEIIGIVATLFILASMSVNTKTLKGDIWMRAINIVGSVVFVVYGVLLPAWSTAILNAALVVVNTVHLILLIKNSKKEKSQQ